AAQAAAQAAAQERAEAAQRATAEQLDKQVVAARELSWKQQYDEAIAGYRAVLAQEPTHYDATRGLADVLGWSGKPAEALPLYEQVYRESHDPEIAQRIAAMKTEIEAGAKVESQRRADETAQSAAADLEQQVVRARELSWQKQYDESIAGYQAVLAKDPQHVEAKQGLADVYYWTGRYAEALPLYQAVYAETKDPELPSRIQAVKTEMAVSIRAPIRRASDGLMIPYRDYLKVGYGHYTYTNKFPDERNLLIEAAKPIGNMTLVGRIEPLNRFGLHDTPLSAELYSPLWRGAWGYIGGSGAFDASFVPVWSLGSEVFQNLGVIAAPLAIFEASMGYKRMEFKTAGIDLLTPGLTLFLPWNLWITEKISYVPAQGSITLSSQLTWRPQERWQFWASYGFGTAGERIRAEQDFARIGSSIWQAGAMFPISSRFSGEVSGYYEDRGFLYVRRGLQLNLIWHW
ncbi:MAG: YaiO family outer membrane beta-barrel protein, partial [Nitrospiraceae bacterium]